MILILNKNLDRLCWDNCWRAFANFGSYKECVKVYRSPGHALRKAKHIGGIVVNLPEGIHVAANGFCWKEVPTKPGYYQVIKLNLLEFQINKVKT